MKKRRIWIKWLLPALWVAFIWARSAKPVEDSIQESGLVLSLLALVLPVVPEVHLVRKTAHFVEYFILGGLCSAAMAESNEPRRVRAALALALGGAIALCDETIQLFAPGRGSMVQDVWLDIAGCAVGALIFGLLRRWSDRRKRKAAETTQP